MNANAIYRVKNYQQKENNEWFQFFSSFFPFSWFVCSFLNLKPHFRCLVQFRFIWIAFHWYNNWFCLYNHSGLIRALASKETLWKKFRNVELHPHNYTYLAHRWVGILNNNFFSPHFVVFSCLWINCFFMRSKQEPRSEQCS